MRELFDDARDKFVHEFSPLQKVGWLAVMGATAIRPFLTSTGTIDYLKNGASWRAAATVGVGDLTDVEGGAARQWGVTTNLGGTLDRLSDKISMLPVEAGLCATGRLSCGDAVVRTLRDIFVTKVRGNVSSDTSSRSTNLNRASTALRMVVNDLCLMPVQNERFKHATRKMQRVSTCVVVASGLRSVVRRRRQQQSTDGTS